VGEVGVLSRHSTEAARENVCYRDMLAPAVAEIVKEMRLYKQNEDDLNLQDTEI
jgi:hypothetical protein